MDSTPLVCVTGQVRSNLIGTDAFQECDITGITIPIVKHSWLVQDVERAAADDQGRVPRRAAPGAAGPSSSTSRATSRRRSSSSATRTTSSCPAGARRARVNAKQVRAAAQAIADAQRPVLYVGGGTINAEACAELRRLAELWRLPVDHDADGEGRVPGDARAALRLARHARRRSGRTGR